MFLVAWTVVVSLLIGGCSGRAAETQRGCQKWKPTSQSTVCCERCLPGNRLVHPCGNNPTELCEPCDPQYYATEPLQPSCKRCNQCVGALVLLKECTSTTDTVCGCRKGLRCGDNPCTFCVEECKKGEESDGKRSCRTCPTGTFNDQIHQMCKPWRSPCGPGEYMVAKGSTVSDIKCNTTFPAPLKVQDPSDSSADYPWQTFAITLLVAFICMALVIISGVTVINVLRSGRTRDKKSKKPIIRTPTDEPQTLIAVECSFHEAQQEQGSSTESLSSKDSKHQLIL